MPAISSDRSACDSRDWSEFRSCSRWPTILASSGPSSAWIADMIRPSTCETIVSVANVSPDDAASSSVRMSAETWYSAVTGSSNSSRM